MCLVMCLFMITSISMSIIITSVTHVLVLLSFQQPRFREFSQKLCYFSCMVCVSLEICSYVWFVSI